MLIVKTSTYKCRMDREYLKTRDSKIAQAKQQRGFWFPLLVRHQRWSPPVGVSQPQVHTDNTLLALCQQEQGVVAGGVLSNFGVHSLTESASHQENSPVSLA